MSLMIAAIFDPLDKIAHLKVPLFVAVCGFCLIRMVITVGRASLPASLTLYVLTVAFLIPLLSMCIYFLRNSSNIEYAGLDYLKAYLFLVLSIVLVLSKLDVVRSLCVILTILSMLLIGVYFVATENPTLGDVLVELGNTYGVVGINQRSYGDLQILGIYFNSSPLLVLPIAYFTYRCVTTRSWSFVVSVGILAINMVAMIMSGTRNNMFVGCLTMFVTLVWYSKRKLALILAGTALSTLIAGMEWNVIRAMLSASEGSNAVKLQHVHDYLQILAEPTTLLIGQGLGAYFNSTAYGHTAVTELTYLEIVRFYGLMFSVPMFVLLLYPITRLIRSDYRQYHHLYIGYGGYLILCMANPFLMSSSGMLILSVVICNAFSFSSTKCPSTASQVARENRFGFAV